jgi:hypothetical protein
MATIVRKKSGKKSVKKAFDKAVSSKGVDTRKYCGIISLKTNPLVIQKQLRDEWE